MGINLEHIFGGVVAAAITGVFGFGYWGYQCDMADKRVNLMTSATEAFKEDVQSACTPLLAQGKGCTVRLEFTNDFKPVMTITMQPGSATP